MTIQSESIATTASYTPREEFINGMKDTIPMVVGAIPFGIIFGATAVLGGLSPITVMGMSLFVFAGSSQFIGANLFSQGLGIGLIVLTTLIVNLRHALYSASLAPYVKHLSQKWLFPLGYWLTDETYAVVISRYNEPDKSPNKHWYYMGSALLMYLNWNLCTFIGIQAGQIPGAERLGLDFAMTVTFIGIVIPFIKNRPTLAAVVVAGVTALLTANMPNKMGLMISALLGIAAGYILESASLEKHLESPTQPEPNEAKVKREA